MIQSLRKTHRRAFIGLSFAIPAVFAGGLLFRKPPPPANPAGVLKRGEASKPARSAPPEEAR